VAPITGTRARAVAAASPFATTGHSHVDLDQGIFYRLAIGKRATKKRQPPVPIPGRPLAHLTRWRDRGIAKTHFVEWNGNRVRSIRKAFKHAVWLAKLDGDATPHTLRHTAATWLMQRGVDLWQAAGFLGMSVETLERNYGHPIRPTCKRLRVRLATDAASAFRWPSEIRRTQN
jgi:integrase